MAILMMTVIAVTTSVIVDVLMSMTIAISIRILTTTMIAVMITVTIPDSDNDIHGRCIDIDEDMDHCNIVDILMAMIAVTKKVNLNDTRYLVVILTTMVDTSISTV